ncbi:MAG: hypothetical protein KDH97_11140 [Calditrichaeota bacterium]|nr:hypothetical protein [Calditrichota bacterium]
MSLKHTLPLLLLLLLFSYLPAGEESGKKLSECVSELVEKMEKANLPERKVRLAVLALSPTGGLPAGASNAFGDYFSETLTSELRRRTGKFKLYERTRLDLILQEAALGQVGVIDAGTAVKIGELAPIDAIFSGTYTPLKQTVAVNARLIDVVSGEILLTYGGKIILNEDIAAMFNPAPPEEQADRCTRQQDGVRLLLNDLSSSEKVDAVVTAAIAIKFDADCGKIHYEVMGAFRRYKIDHAGYRDFLIATLNNIEFPGNDNRALEILRFLGKDGAIDEQEWAEGLKATVKIGNYSLSGYLRALLRPENILQPEALTVQRGGVFLDMALRHEVGLPVAIDFDRAFQALMRGLVYNYAEDNRYLIPLYRQYHPQLAGEDPPFIYSLLTNMYWRENGPAVREEILGWIITHFQQRNDGEKAATSLYEFAESLEKKGRNQYGNNDDAIPAPPVHQTRFLEACRELLCRALAETRYRSQVEDREDFCLEHGIVCPGVIPSVAECLETLESENNYERDRAAELLARMGERAAPAEGKMIEIVSRSTLNRDQYGSEVRRQAVRVLGNLRSSDGRAIAGLCDLLASTEYRMPDDAIEALTRIGAPAVPQLRRKLFDRFGSVQYRAAVILGQIGAPARAALPDLQKLADTTLNGDIRNAAMQAVQQIRK